VIVFSIRVNEALLVHPLPELTTTSIISPPFKVKGTIEGSNVFEAEF